jgi:aspartate/methionine/tyrosine aminotransferase
MIIPTANRLHTVPEYYFSHKLREIKQRVARGEDILNLGIGSPDLDPPEAFKKELIRKVAEPGLHAYQPYKGIPELRSAFADFYSRMYGVLLNPENEIQPLMGSKEGIMHISLAFLNPGDQVLVPDPGYLTYGSVSKLVGAEVIPYDLDAANDWEPNWLQLEAMDLSKVKLMWVSYPNMPTGAPGSTELFDKLIAFARQHKILLVNDNPYSLIRSQQPASILSHPEARELAIELNSMSKSHHIAGWRVGVVVGDADYIQAVLQVTSNMASGMGRPLQEAAAHILKQDYAWHIEQNSLYESRFQLAMQIMDTLGCTYEENQTGMFLWAKIPDWAPNSEVFSNQILDEAFVFLTPGFIFGNNGEGYMRISLCSPLHHFEVALERVQQFAQTHGISSRAISLNKS